MLRSPRQFLNFLGWVFSGAFTICLGTRLFRLIDQYSVNLLFWDNFNYYFLLADRWNYWQRFTAQLGPHREGFGLLLSSIIAPLTNWNMRAEAFCIGAILVIAMLLCLLVKRRAFNRLEWYDVIVISALFFNPRQWEIWGGTVNSSHDALPLAFVMLFCLSWTIARGVFRDVAILTINFLAIFTGFGFFLGIITPTVFALRRNWRAFAISLASLVLFFVNYKFDPAFGGFRFFDPNVLKFPFTMAVALSYACDVNSKPWDQIIGYFLLAFFLAAFAAQARGAARGKVRNIISTSLIGFTILFMLAAVEGRISLGPRCLDEGRYIPLLTPGFVGAYLSISSVPNQFLRLIFVILFAGLALRTSLFIDPIDLSAMIHRARDKQTWIANYQLTGSIDQANQASLKPIYPAPLPADLPAKVAYLRDHKLNFFSLPPQYLTDP